MKIPKIYISAPYSDNPEENVKRVLKVADKLLEFGYIPVIPHLYHYWNKISPKPYETWIRLGKVLLQDCDLVLRLSGDSKGADGEVKLAHDLGIPVIFLASDDQIGSIVPWIKYVESHHLSGIILKTDGYVAQVPNSYEDTY